MVGEAGRPEEPMVVDEGVWVDFPTAGDDFFDLEDIFMNYFREKTCLI